MEDSQNFFNNQNHNNNIDNVNDNCNNNTNENLNNNLNDDLNDNPNENEIKLDILKIDSSITKNDTYEEGENKFEFCLEYKPEENSELNQNRLSKIYF